jgi:uncharacterized protein (TIGR02117 family)
MNLLKAISRLITFLIQLLFDIIIVYFFFTLIGCFWGRNTNEALNNEGVPLMIHGDGFHTELYLPVQDSMGIINWMDWFNDSTIRAKHQHKKLINFAWAEADWTLAGANQQPKGIITTAKIFLWPRNKSVMHVQWMDDVWPIKNPVTITRYLSQQQYRQLVAFLKNSFEQKDGKPMIRSYKGYYGFDYLFYSVKTYHSFNTCNQFTSDALHACGVRNATFSPFGWGLFYQLQITSSSYKPRT